MVTQEEATVYDAVRCRGCKKQLGISTGVHNGVYCSMECKNDIPATEHEGRDSVISLLSAMGTDRSTLVSEFGLTKQRISQILGSRSLSSSK